MQKPPPLPSEGEPGLRVQAKHPENLEAPVNALDNWLTPNPLFYIRNHLNYPFIEMDRWRLIINGQVNNPLALSYDDLRQMPQVSMFTTLECSGNKRGLLKPKAQGEQWEMGAVSNAKWTGIPLPHFLKQVGLKPWVTEIVFWGIDSGTRPDMPGLFNFGRSLPLPQAMSEKVILALAMNDQPIPFKHGFPLRLIVPGWYGMASVKWLGRISAISGSFKGPFQTVDYVYLPKENDYSRAIPVTLMKVNSIIIKPGQMEVIKPGPNLIKGLAWSGNAAIERVEVSTDGGNSWLQARLTSSEHRVNTWTFWECDWQVENPGHYTLMVRAVDSRGSTQPREVPWNAKGYGNNSWHRIEVIVPRQLLLR